MSELKPCPFCGGEAFINLERDCRWVECRKCGAMGYVEIGGEAEAIEAWNMRAGCENCAALNKAAGLWAKADKRARDLERTCHNISEDGFLCSACTFGDFGSFKFEPNYCPNCGASVVSE